MFSFRDNTSLSNFSFILTVAAKSFSSHAISGFSSDCKSKFEEDCSSSISGGRCELDELSDVSKISLKLAVSTTSLIFSFKLCDTVAAVLGMRGTGGSRLRGELRFQVKTEGTAPFLKKTAQLKLLFKSSDLKCHEQTLVVFEIWKFFPSSL